MQAPSKPTAGGGYGLGLLGIRERLHALGGSLRINSVSGQGTELLVSVPWRTDAAPIRIVIAEDHLIVREGFKAMLERRVRGPRRSGRRP